MQAADKSFGTESHHKCNVYKSTSKVVGLCLCGPVLKSSQEQLTMAASKYVLWVLELAGE